MCYARIIQSTTVLYDVMVTYLAKQNCNDSCDWIINSSRFIGAAFITKVSTLYIYRTRLLPAVDKNHCQFGQKWNTVEPHY